MKNFIIFILILLSSTFTNAQSTFIIEPDEEEDSTCFVEGNNRYFNYPNKSITYFYFNCDDKIDTLKFNDKIKSGYGETSFILPISLKLVLKRLILSGCLITIDIQFNSTYKTIKYNLNDKRISDMILN